MGNMLPCLVQGTALPAMSSKQRLRSLKRLMSALHKTKRPFAKPKVVTNEAAPRNAHGRKGGQKRGVVRVKVVLTKQEAARLLSLTVGGERTVAQIVSELRRTEAAGRANAAAAAAWRPALESIPEEC